MRLKATRLEHYLNIKKLQDYPFWRSYLKGKISFRDYQLEVTKNYAALRKDGFSKE